MRKFLKAAGLALTGFVFLAPLPPACARGPLSTPEEGSLTPVPEASPVLREASEEDGKTDKEVERRFEEGGSPLSYSRENPKPAPKAQT